ncbi:MAG TPA: MFS transporter [Ktedonobacteraceae bacterium]|nr:MFS transporter [Ktedonobacteraceae bacterium]
MVVGMLSPLHNRNYTLLFSGQLISNIGDAFYWVALPWFMLSSGGGAQALGLALTFYGIPRVGSLLLGGPLSDHLRPRRVMLLSDIARVFLSGALAILMLQGHPASWLLYTVLALMGFFAGLFTPAAWSITPYILSNDDLQAGNAITTSSQQVALFIGSTLAGVIVSHFQPGIAVAIDALSFMASAITLGAMGERKERLPQEQPDESKALTLQQVPTAFWQLLRTSRYLQVLLVMTTFMNFGAGAALEVGLPVYIHDGLRAGASGYGLVLSAFSVGALLGALAAGALGKLPHRAFLSLICFIVEAFAMTLVPFLSNVQTAACAMLIAGILNGLGNVLGVTVMQQALPRQLLGRIMGALALTNFGFYPLSVALGGILVAHYGPIFVFLLNGMLLLIPCIFGLFQREFREL